PNTAFITRPSPSNASSISRRRWFSRRGPTRKPRRAGFPARRNGDRTSSRSIFASAAANIPMAGRRVARITVSTATVEFRPNGSGTRMIYTEQIVFLDGVDNLAGRREGTEAAIDYL